MQRVAPLDGTGGTLGLNVTATGALLLSNVFLTGLQFMWGAQIGKFIKHMHKQKYCNVKDFKGEIKILSIDRSCPAYTDFERGFIKAEIYNFKDWKDNECSELKVKEAGKYRQEGKGYVVKDKDIIFFKFNVTADAKKK